MRKYVGMQMVCLLSAAVLTACGAEQIEQAQTEQVQTEQAQTETVIEEEQSPVENTPEKEYVYGTATLTYAEYYAGDVTSTENYDAVSSATVKKYELFSNAYTDFVDEETNQDGYHLLGVQNVNIAVEADDVEAYSALNPTFVQSQEIPSQYKTVELVDGVAQYSATTLNVVDTIKNATAELLTRTHWGDYQINIYDNEGEDAANYLRRDREDEWPINSSVQGIIVETEDGLKVGMEYLQSIWVQPYEISFNVDSINEGNSNMIYDNLAELSKLVEKNVTKVTFLMPDSAYVYEFAGIYIKPAYVGEEVVRGSFAEGSAELSLENIPEALENVTVTVIKGSGRESEIIADHVEVTDGVVTLTEAFDAEQTYSVALESTNYADIVVEASK